MSRTNDEGNQTGDMVERLGRYKWLEMAQFEVLGTWVAIVDDPVKARRLAHDCSTHEFHARLWRRRLIELGCLRPEEVTAAPSTEVASLFNSLAGELTVAERLVGLYRVVVPGLVAAWTVHRDHLQAVFGSNSGHPGLHPDLATARLLDIRIAHGLDQWRRGEVLLQSTLGVDDLQSVARYQTELLTLLALGGGMLGPLAEAFGADT